MKVITTSIIYHALMPITHVMSLLPSYHLQQLHCLSLEKRISSCSLAKKNSVDDIALKLGLNVVPKKQKLERNDKLDEATHGGGKSDSSGMTRRKKEAKKKLPNKVPTIKWDKNVHNFFWGDTSLLPDSSFEGQQTEWIENEEDFPLYLIRNVLPSESVNRVMSLLMDDRIISNAEEMEQHELVNGKPQALRRSLVSRLVYNNDRTKSKVDADGGSTNPDSIEILDMISSRLPTGLVGEVQRNGAHPYEDGSVVYYRANGEDFYNTHHDSYDPEEPPRERQRAYTILVYLLSPPGDPLLGGTEFPFLTPKHSPGNLSNGQKTEPKRGLMCKPRAGDALIWPNFDRDGKPCMDSIHRALSYKDKNESNNNSRIGKIVINMWFEGKLR